MPLIQRARIVFANEQFLKLTGWKEQEVIGQDWFDMFIPNQIREEIRKVFHETMRQKDALAFSTFENEILTKSGELLNVAWSNVVNKDAQGNVSDVTCLGVDLTERKRAEEALKESKMFLDNMSDIAYMADDQGNVTWVNSAFERITGLPPEEIMGKPFLPLFIKDDHASLIDVYKRTLLGESLEKTLTFTSGVTCHFTSLPKRNDKGEIIGTFGVARDITDRLIAEKALQISEDRLKKAQEAAKIGNWEYDVSTGKVWGSEEAFRIYGIERTSEYLPLDEVENQILEAKRVNQALVDLITKGEDYDIEFQITQKNSRKLVTIHSIADLIKDDEGNPVKVIGVIQDITDKKAKEEEHIKLLGQLQQAQKMEAIGTLAGGIAHDFNNILFPIVGYTEMLIDEAAEKSTTHDWLNMILNSAMRARDLVQQILTFSRQQEQKLKPLKAEIIVKEALKLMRASLPFHH